jgi:exopolyphosphatase/pppGpp-phosphohydrolase
MWGRHHDRVPVGVIDVGSNTVRLLVVGGGRQLLTVREPLG